MEENDEETEEPKAKSKMPIILGLLLAVLGGGGGFYATSTGMIFGQDDAEQTQAQKSSTPDIQDIKFVQIEPIIIPLPDGAKNTHLRFRSQLEVPSNQQSEVELLLPRVIDVLNSYLRALTVADIENPSALSRIRAQMLRRVQVVVGSGRVRDLLIMEFVLN